MDIKVAEAKRIKTTAQDLDFGELLLHPADGGVILMKIDGGDKGWDGRIKAVVLACGEESDNNFYPGALVEIKNAVQIVPVKQKAPLEVIKIIED